MNLTIFLKETFKEAFAAFSGTAYQGRGIFIGLLVVLCLIEAIFIRRTFFMGFVIGAAAAVSVALLGAVFGVQIGVFLAISFIALYLFHANDKKKRRSEDAKNKADPRIGKEALVVAEIMPFNFGQVQVDGNVCMAVSKEKNATIKKGTTVRIGGVDGVELIVSPLDDENPRPTF